MTERDDDMLIRKAQDGDRDAFAALVEKHYRLMFRSAWQWCGNKSDAEDIAQDAAVKLAENIRAFRFESAFSTWLYRLTINTAKDHYKAKNRRNAREETLPEYEDAAFASPDLTPEQKMENADVLKALGSLSEELRETVILVCWQGMSHKEAGLMLDCAEGTVSWRVSEARKKIADYLGMAGKGKRHG